MTAFVSRCDPGVGPGPTLAVKDLIDVAGLPTTCGSEPVAASAHPAILDADCVAAARAAGARIVGKTRLHELAFGGSGVNAWSGTPVNPLDSTRIPGGSSSGSAVAVANGEADIALGTDTGGSIRTPSACCGTVGLKTTFGRLSVIGIHPLAPSLDTVGPMARTVAGVIEGMALLEAGFEPADAPAAAIGRFHLGGVAPWIERAIDAALAALSASGLGVDIRPVHLPGWDLADQAGSTVAFAEASRVNARLLADHANRLGDEVRERLRRGTEISDEDYDAALAMADPWRNELDLVLARTPVIALAGIMNAPAPLDDPLRLDTRRPNVAVNLAGHPAVVLPIPVPAGSGDASWSTGLPTSLQLVANHGAEDLLVATAAAIEAAIG